jgi:hypothetical protein
MVHEFVEENIQKSRLEENVHRISSYPQYPESEPKMFGDGISKSISIARIKTTNNENM